MKTLTTTEARMHTGTQHILIVDDEPHLCTGLRRILELEGYDVTTAHDGETALHAAAARQPDLVLLDLMMPGMDGREVCRKLREAGNPARVVYFTAHSQPTSLTGSRELMQEADGVISKPATGRRIVSKVRSVLAQHPAGRNTAAKG